ncbi:MAG: ATP-binding cassette domain-containing protein [Chloroflexota bacterium]
MSNKPGGAATRCEAKETPPLIDYRNVTVVKNDRTILDNITLSIALGENAAIIGPNGSGKTSLIKTVTREYYPLSTDPEPYQSIFGNELWNIFDLRKLIGVVTNELANDCVRYHLPVWEAILSSFFGSIGLHHQGRVSPTLKKKTQQLMERLEISHLSERYLAEVSNGELRRVIIARALVHEPKALLLDEPTSSLDFRATGELREILRKVARAGTSIIMVTHNLPDLVPEINRVILLKEGRIFKDGTKSEVLTSENLSSLYGLSLEVVRRDAYYYVW